MSKTYWSADGIKFPYSSLCALLGAEANIRECDKVWSKKGQGSQSGDTVEQHFLDGEMIAAAHEGFL